MVVLTADLDRIVCTVVQIWLKWCCFHCIDLVVSRVF